jgi:hypothetical protein
LTKPPIKRTTLPCLMVKLPKNSIDVSRHFK